MVLGYAKSIRLAVLWALTMYEFAPPCTLNGAWWKRTYVDDWLSPLSLRDPRLEKFFSDVRWLPSPVEEEPQPQGTVTSMPQWLGDNRTPSCAS
jgi:hypothetical protein